MSKNEELRGFLRSCRARLQPEDIGLTFASRRNDPQVRRVEGLRREEVARVAGVSVDYYTRLEQGRTNQVGGSILRAVADTLQLNPTEREYLFHLVNAQREPDAAVPRRPASRVRPSLQRVVDGSADAAAFVLGTGMHILAMNRLASELLFEEPSLPPNNQNLARWTFLSPVARARYLDWDAVAADAAAILRRDLATSGDDTDLIDLIGELNEESPEFRRMWQQHLVYTCTFGSKRIRHPLVGEILIDYEAFEVPNAPGQKLFIYTTAADSPSAAALELLAAWTTPREAGRATGTP